MNRVVIDSLLELDKNNENFVVVASSSMFPVLKPGDKISIEKTEPDKIAIGQVVVFKDRFDRFIAHRVVEKSGYILITAGDSNRKDDDPAHIFDVVGIVKETAIKIPLSKLSRFFRSIKRRIVTTYN